MEMEEEDALEEKALTDIALDDPLDMGYAFAEMKKRDKLKNMAKNGELGKLNTEEESLEYGSLVPDESSYDRNINQLGKSLRESRSLSHHTALRTSKTVQDEFISRKKRELEKVHYLICN
jgi:hypothetical protein